MTRHEFNRALKATGHRDLAREGGGDYLFSEIDQNGCGRITEREFCEWFVFRAGYGDHHHHHHNYDY
jgi:hypothetical protein